MRKIIVGVMGPGEQATAIDLQTAYELGKLVAQQGWVLLTGGRNVGVMDATSQGAKSANGLTIGILPGSHAGGVSAAVDIAIITGMGNARNNINVLSSDVVIACGVGTGTVSEIALALKADKKAILLNQSRESRAFFKCLSPQNLYIVDTPSEAIETVAAILNNSITKF